MSRDDRCAIERKTTMRTWFITGISRGLGLSIAKAALAERDYVVGTVRGAAPHIPSHKGNFTFSPRT